MQFGFDHADVTKRIHPAADVHDIGPLKTADHVKKRIHFPDVAKKLIAEAFTLARPFDEPGNVADFQRAIGGFLRLEDFGQLMRRGSGTRAIPVLGSTVAKG